MKKSENISFIMSTKGIIPSVNSLYKAMIKRIGNKQFPVIYKDPDAKRVIEELTEQLKMIDFSKYTWLYEKDAIFDLNIQLIFKQSFGRRDTDNTIKLLQDSIFRHLGLNDSRVISVTATKSICESLKEEKICINIQRSHKEIHFDKLEELPIPEKIYLTGNSTKSCSELIEELTKLNYNYYCPLTTTENNLDVDENEKNNNCDCHIYLLDPNEKLDANMIINIIDSSHEVKQLGYNCCILGILGEEKDWNSNDLYSIDLLINKVNLISNGSKKVWAGFIKDSTNIMEHLGIPKKKRKKKGE